MIATSPMTTFTTNPAGPAPSADLESLFELLLSGGPLMIPIGLCSVVALAYATERWVRLRPRFLGTPGFGQRVVSELKERGPDAALGLCEAQSSPLARILRTGLERASHPFLDREKAVEDTAASEMKAQLENLRPLFLVWLIAPLLGLLGTVWGMIEAFSNIAGADGLGRPELLASGIYKALTTTAAGLAVSIPAIVAYWVLKGRVEAFARRFESVYRELEKNLTPSV